MGGIYEELETRLIVVDRLQWFEKGGVLIVGETKGFEKLYYDMVYWFE